MILLDTNVISELVKLRPDANVVSVFDSLPASRVFTAAICEAEIRYRFARMPAGQRRDPLKARIATFFEEAFRDQVLPFDSACASLYGDIRHERELMGRPIGVQDAMIAATVRAYGASALATRNTRDFEGCGIDLVDPWLGTEAIR